MKQFNEEMKEFLKKIEFQENELDWRYIPGYKVITEERYPLGHLREQNKIIGIAGVTIRHFVLPSLFIAVDKKYRGKGIATKLIKAVLNKWRLPLFLTYYKNKPFL